MHKARGFLPKASKAWLYNAALFALICAAFAAGIIIGPMLASRGNKDERKIRCTPDAMAQKTPTTVDSKCVSSKEFQALLLEWSQSSQIIDEKMLNVSIRKIIPSMRKQLRANNDESKKALQEMFRKVLANWTTQFLQHINNNLQSNETERVTVVKNKENTKDKTEVIDVDSVVPPLRPGKQASLPVAVALYPLNGEFTTWDVSGRNNPNGIARGVRLAPGPNGQPNGSYQFSGKSSSYIEFPNMGALRVKNSLTLLAWVYVKSKGGPIFNYNPMGWGVSMWINSLFRLTAKFVEHDEGCKTCFTSVLPLKRNAWHYIGMSYDHSTGIAKLWVDGKVSVKRNIGTKVHLSTARNARMGARALNDGAYFDGRISRLQVYDKVLSQREIETVSGPIQVGRCPQGWTGHRSSCYLVFNRLTNQWNQARQVCQEHGGDLVEIGSSEENNFVYALARSKAYSQKFMWIGLLRGSADETFSWVNDPYPPLYSNWALGEPNDFSGRGENCGHMYIWTNPKGKQWNDELCVDPYIGSMIFMCEIQPVDKLRMTGSYKVIKSTNVIDGEGSSDQSASGEETSESNSGSEFGFMN